MKSVIRYARFEYLATLGPVRPLARSPVGQCTAACAAAVATFDRFLARVDLVVATTEYDELLLELGRFMGAPRLVLPGKLRSFH